MERKIIYVDNVGYVDPKEDHELIIWFWDQQMKGRSHNVQTSFWLAKKREYWNKLLALQAFELMAKISESVTDKQEKRRQYYDKRRKEKAAVEWKAFIETSNDNKFHRSLIRRALCNN